MQKEIHLNRRLLPIIVGLLLFVHLIAPFRGWFILFIGLGGTWLVSYLWARSLLRGLHLVREMRFGWVHVGDQIRERYRLDNVGWAPALWVQLHDHSTLPEYQVSRVLSMGGGRSVLRWFTEAKCTRRGVFNLGPITIHTGDPFGLYTVSLHYPASSTLTVIPAIVPLQAVKVAQGWGARAGSGRSRTDFTNRTITAVGVREYQPGDSLRWIHWPTTARLAAPFVRIFDGTPTGHWQIFLDLDEKFLIGSGQHSTEEHSVILAASLADRGLRSRRAVGLITHGKELVQLPPAEGNGQRRRILHTLAQVSAGQQPLAHLLALPQPASRRNATLIIITTALDGDWITALMPWLRRGAVPTVLLLDPTSYGGSGNVNSTLAKLSDLGVEHYVITRDMLDRPEILSGQQRHRDEQLVRRKQLETVPQPWKVIS